MVHPVDLSLAHASDDDRSWDKWGLAWTLGRVDLVHIRGLPPGCHLLQSHNPTPNKFQGSGKKGKQSSGLDVSFMQSIVESMKSMTETLATFSQSKRLLVLRPKKSPPLGTLLSECQTKDTPSLGEPNLI